MKKILLLSVILTFISANIFANTIEVKDKDIPTSQVNKLKNQKNFPAPTYFMVAEDGLATWQQPLVFISQNLGEGTDSYYESMGCGYGVVFDLSNYPDAIAHSLEFHHQSFGLYGFWDYKLHIINWDTQEFIASFDNLATKGDDIWETNIPLDSTDLQGANLVAFLMEPLGNDSTDAYPDITADHAEDSQGSVWGPLSNLSSFESSNIGNFLMNIYIMTSSGKKIMAPVTLDIPTSQYSKKKLGFDTSDSPSINQAKDGQELIAYNLYLDGELITSTNDLLWQYTGLIIGEDYTAGISALYENGESEIIGCDFTANETTSIPMINSSRNKELQIIPNPSTGLFSVSSLNNLNIQEVKIISPSGKLVSAIRCNNVLKQTIDLSNLPQGIYIIKIQTMEGVKTSKVIIN